MSPADVRARARQARGFLKAARLVDEFTEGPGAEYEIATPADVIAALAVLAGIAAADAICGEAHGKRSNSGNHADATVLLRQAVDPGASAVAQLRTLIELKSRAHYEAQFVTRTEASTALTAATRLVATMEAAVR